MKKRITHLVPMALSFALVGQLPAQEPGATNRPDAQNAAQGRESGQQREGGPGQTQAQQPHTGDRSSAMSEATQKIRGTVVGVAAAGEAVWNAQTNRAMVAEIDYLTVVGKPVQEAATRQPAEQTPRAGQASAEKSESASSNDKASSKQGQDKLKDADPSDRVGIQVLDNLGQNPAEAGGAAGQPGQKAAGANQSGPMQRRHNVYMVALSPRTKACCREMSEDTNLNSNPQTGQKDQPMEVRELLSQIEIGDEVEIEFQPMKSGEQRTTAGQTQERRDQQLQRTGGEVDDRGSTRAGNAGDSSQQAGRNGRERVYWGQAVSIALMTSERAGEEASQSGQPRSREEGAGGSREESKPRENRAQENSPAAPSVKP